MHVIARMVVVAVLVTVLTVSMTLTLNQKQKGFGMADTKDGGLGLLKTIADMFGFGQADENADFKEDMAMSESSNKSDVVNTDGFMGKYQFGDDRLTDFKNDTGSDFDKTDFLNDESLQDQVFDWHVNDISNYIDSNDLNSFIGKTINGIKITKQGLIAGAHLGGKYGMRQFLETGGEYNPSDKNGTKISDYITKFNS
tara:strand:- start:936 stop:1529 length:594 start_codon:yes stop_codon:yes gene_type:complete